MNIDLEFSLSQLLYMTFSMKQSFRP